MEGVNNVQGNFIISIVVFKNVLHPDQESQSSPNNLYLWIKMNLRLAPKTKLSTLHF